MFDTNIIDGCRVAFIEPKSLVHEVLSFVAAQKIMAILCSDDETDAPEIVFGTSHARRIKLDPSYVPAVEVSREFDISPTGINWLYITNLLKPEFTLNVSLGGRTSQCNYLQLTSFGEEVLDDLEKGQEVELNLD